MFNGEKIYITNATIADAFHHDGSDRQGEGCQGHLGILRRTRFPWSVGWPNERKMGMHGCGSTPVLMHARSPG